MMSIVSLSLMLAYIACSLRSAMAVGWMLGWRLVHGPVHPIRLGILFRHWTETSIAPRLAPSLPAPLSLTLCVSHTRALLALSPFLNICNICNRQTGWSPSPLSSFQPRLVLRCPELTMNFLLCAFTRKYKTKVRCLTEGQKIFKVKIKIYLQQECRDTRVWASTIILCWAMLFKQGV